MTHYSLFMIDSIVLNAFTDIWAPILSLVIALIALGLSTYYAFNSYKLSLKIDRDNKRETLYDIFNSFLLYLETIANANKYEIKNIEINGNKIDSLCVNVIGKVRDFYQKNNMLDCNSNVLDDFIDEVLRISNGIQKKSISDEELEKFSDDIRILRRRILESITKKDFFKEKKEEK